MRGIPGLVEMRSESNRGFGNVGLKFEIGTDMTRVMLDVVSRLNTCRRCPRRRRAASIWRDNFQTQNAGSLQVRPLRRATRFPNIAAEYQKLMEEVVEPRLSRIKGFRASTSKEGGREKSRSTSIRTVSPRSG